MPLVRNVWGLLFSLALVSVANAASYSYATHQLQLTDLGAGVHPTAINNVGQVAGQAAGNNAILWSNGVTNVLPTFGGTTSFANDLNDSGTVVGWSLNSVGQQKPFRWDGATMMNLEPQAVITGAAESVNNLGDIVGWRTNGTIYKSAWWLPNLPEPHQFDPHPWTTIFDNELVNNRSLGISDLGLYNTCFVVGATYSVNPGNYGELVDSFYYDGAGGSTNFSSIMYPDYNPQAGVNTSLLTAGTNGDQAAYLTIGPNHLSTLPKLSLSDDFSAFYGLNDLNQIVGTSGEKGILYDQPTSTLFDLNLFPGQTLGFGQVLRLTDINNNGTFVGVALVGGVEHGFVGQLVPVPEPSTWLLLSVAVASLCVTRAAFSAGAAARGYSRPNRTSVSARHAARNGRCTDPSRAQCSMPTFP